MFKSKLTRKVIAIIGFTLIIGFAGMGLLTIYLEYSSTIDLQKKLTRQLATTVVHDVLTQMMKGDLKEYDAFVVEAKKRGVILDMKLFNAKGQERGSGTQNSEMKQALDTSRQLDFQDKKDGQRVLNLAVPLVDEERCRSCHTQDSKYLGGVLLTTSLEEGYNSALQLTLVISAVGVFFFFAMLVALYICFNRIVVRKIAELDTQLGVLAGGGGDLTKELTISSDDEIGELGQQVNLMTSKIREIISSLYQQACQIGTGVCEQAAGTDRTL